MKSFYTIIFTIFFTFSGLSQGYQFGIQHNSGYNFSIVAIPDFDATDTDVSDIGFTLMLPAGDTDIINTSQFNGRPWAANQFTAAQLSGAGFGDGTRDAFVINLPPGQSIVSHTTDTPFVIFTFDISNSPTQSFMDLLPNSDPIAMGLGGALDSFFNSNIDNTNTQDYFSGIASGQGSFMFETLDVDDIELENYSIAVYPNPALDILHVSTPFKVQKLILYDILGKQIMSLKDSKSMIVEHLRSGAYFLKIETETTTITKRIIKK
ncbi:T9SS type A sorting domain-containing protein [uncultured Psychroserpens sp.]|uniref:T9SS type A sorting domain-containing protein n=1 Tax=uncultured Psychroserpens sp. TaxID=255436 RepID=UPI002638BED9|nr:T9SS type A sorting domain-containing protein [uncultured Psychroserpens sp.]